MFSKPIACCNNNNCWVRHAIVHIRLKYYLLKATVLRGYGYSIACVYMATVLLASFLFLLFFWLLCAIDRLSPALPVTLLYPCFFCLLFTPGSSKQGQKGDSKALYVSDPIYRVKGLDYELVPLMLWWRCLFLAMFGLSLQWMYTRKQNMPGRFEWFCTGSRFHLGV